MSEGEIPEGVRRPPNPVARELIAELGQLISAKDAEIARLHELWSTASHFVRGCLEALGLPEPAPEADGTAPCDLENLRLQIIGVIEGLKGEMIGKDAEIAKLRSREQSEQRCRHGRVICEPCAQMAVRKATPDNRAAEPRFSDDTAFDTRRLDFVEGECVELRCKESRNYDDADVYFEAVKFFMAAPKEKVVGIGNSPREAIDAAMRNEDDKCAYCEGEGCTLCCPVPARSEPKAGEEPSHA